MPKTDENHFQGCKGRRMRLLGLLELVYMQMEILATHFLDVLTAMTRETILESLEREKEMLAKIQTTMNRVWTTC